MAERSLRVRGATAREGEGGGAARNNTGGCRLVSSRGRVVFVKTGCNVGAVVTRAYRSASCYSDGSERLRARELGDGLGALGHGVLGELAREHEADRRLDLARREGRLLGEAAQLGRLERDALEDVVDEPAERTSERGCPSPARVEGRKSKTRRRTSS